MTEGRPSTDSITNSQENGELPEVFCMPDYFDERIDVQAEEVPSEIFNVKMNKKNHVGSAAEVLLRISRDCLKNVLEEILHFLQTSILTSSD